MQATLTISKLEQLRALADPLRLRVLRRLREGPATIGEVAEALDESPNKLYYHFVELEKRELIRHVATRQHNNLVEKLYAPVAEQLVVDRALLHLAPGALRERFYDGVVAVLDEAAADLREALHAGALPPGEPERAIARRVQVRLAPRQAEAFRVRLLALCEELRAAADAAAEAEADLTVVFYATKP